MNRNFWAIQESGLGFLLTVVSLGLLLSAVGLGWIVNGLLVLLALVILLPVIAFGLFRWWLQRNVIEADCPSCGFPLTGLNHSAVSCPSCGEALIAEAGGWRRQNPPGTVDVEAVEVAVEVLED